MVQFDHKGEKGYGHVIEGAADAQDEDALEEGEKGGGEFPWSVCLLCCEINLSSTVSGTLRVRSSETCLSWKYDSGVGLGE